MAAHALEDPPGGQIPEEDPAGVVGGGEDLAAGAAGQGCDARRVAGKHAHGLPVTDGPHADGAVGTRGEDVSAIGMESDDVDALLVAGEEAEGPDVVGGPESGGFVVACGDEVVAEGAPGEVPDGAVVGFVDDDLLEEVERPEADGGVGAGGEEPAVGGGGGGVGRRGTGWRKGDGVDGTGVPDQTAGIGEWGVVVSVVGIGSGDSFAVERPDADVGFRGAGCDEGIVAGEVETCYAGDS